MSPVRPDPDYVAAVRTASKADMRAKLAAIRRPQVKRKGHPIHVENQRLGLARKPSLYLPEDRK